MVKPHERSSCFPNTWPISNVLNGKTHRKSTLSVLPWFILSLALRWANVNSSRWADVTSLGVHECKNLLMGQGKVSATLWKAPYLMERKMFAIHAINVSGSYCYGCEYSRAGHLIVDSQRSLRMQVLLGSSGCEVSMTWNEANYTSER